MSSVVIAGTPPAGDTALPVANSIDAVNDYLAIYTASATATQAINRNTLLGISSQPVGISDSQTLTNKTLTSPTISGPTFSGTLIGTYTIGGTPTFPASVTTLTGSQTLTNKTLTSPTINSPTITNATLSSDTITGYSTSNTGTIFGLSVTTGTLGSSALAANAVQANQLATNAITLGYAQITTSDTTTSTTAVQATGLTSTVTIPAGGRKVKITVFTESLANSTASKFSILSLWDGTVGSGTQLATYNVFTGTTANAAVGATMVAVVTPAAGSKTYNVGFATDASSGGTVILGAASTSPAFILVEAI